MAKIQTIKNKDDIVIYPQTHTMAVFTNEGGRLQDKLDQYLTTEDIGELEEVAAIAELQSNKVTEINENSTDTTYPSAKAVYEAIAKNNGARLNIIIPADGTRPTEGEASAIYLIPAENAETENVYEEWIYINSNWEMIGTTKIDLSNYYTKIEAGEQFAKLSLYGDTTINIGRKANTTIGLNSVAEGIDTTASGHQSHAEGVTTTASGNCSHAEGMSTTASGMDQHVQGRYNIVDSNETYAHIVGNGTLNTSSNAHTLTWTGEAWYQGDVYVGSTSGTNKDEGSKKLATEEYVDNNLGCKILQANSNNPIDFNTLTDSGIYIIKGVTEFTAVNVPISYISAGSELIDIILIVNNSFSTCYQHFLHGNQGDGSTDYIRYYRNSAWTSWTTLKTSANEIAAGVFIAGMSCETPTEDSHLVNKVYVDTLVGDIEAALTALTSGSGVA